MRVPRRLKELHLALNNATSELTQQLSRAPNPTELAAHLNVERDEILDALAVANGYRSDSLDEPIRGEPDLPSLLDTLGEDDPYLEGVEYREVLQPLLADMPARERTIVVLRFFGNLTQS